MNLLSVDWDYFFPCADWYDWGHKEDPMFMEFLWKTRPGSMHIRDHVLAIDGFVPRVDEVRGFWDRVCSKTKFLVVADSHSDIKHPLKMGGWTVWNFDTHHDLRYGKRGKNPNQYRCDNWGDVGKRKKKIDKYNLVYPEWRRGEEETFPDSPICDNVFYGIPKDLPEFDAVFICRSSAWIPTWWDPLWIEFIEYWKKDKQLWDSKVSCEFALRERKPNMEDARKIAKEHVKQREEFIKQMKK